MFMPALIGGAVAGFLSAIPIVNCLCCLWIIGGAMLAAYLLAKNSSVSLKAGDGAIVGIFSGLIAAVIEAFVSIPFDAFNREFIQKLMDRFAEYMEEMPSGWEAWMDKGAGGVSFSWFMIGLFVSAVIFAVLGALGGVIGASLFGKKTTPPQGVGHETPQDTGHHQP